MKKYIFKTILDFLEAVVFGIITLGLIIIIGFFHWLLDIIRWIIKKKNDGRCLYICTTDPMRGWVSQYQCNKKNGYGLDGLYCKLHSTMAKE